MWDVLNSSQVLTLTFEFSSPWPHHLMPLTLHSYPPPPSPPPLSLLLFCLSVPSCIPSSTSIPLVSLLLYISASAQCCCPPSPLCPLSQVSDRPISAPMIAVGVLAWQLSKWWQEWAQPGSKCCLCCCSQTHLTERPMLRDRQQASTTTFCIFCHTATCYSPTLRTRHFGNCLPRLWFYIQKAGNMMDGRWGFAEIANNRAPPKSLKEDNFALTLIM